MSIVERIQRIDSIDQRQITFRSMPPTPDHDLTQLTAELLSVPHCADFPGVSFFCPEIAVIATVGTVDGESGEWMVSSIRVLEFRGLFPGAPGTEFCLCWDLPGLPFDLVRFYGGRSA